VVAVNNPGAAAPRGTLFRLWDSDFSYQFRRSPVAMLATLVVLILLIAAVFAPRLAPHNTLDLATLDLIDARQPPAWIEGGDRRYLLGTDEQGRDILSAVMFGTRISLLIGFVSVVLSMLIGVGLGLISGYAGGRIDAFVMRVADVQLSFPAILIALLVNGLLRVALPKGSSDMLAFVVLIAAITASGWVQYARTVRGLTLVEKGRDYVLAARVIGVNRIAILFKHVLPNVVGPVLILATVQIATAIITEATLSFLGVGAPPTRPSLGTLIDNGNKYLYSGEWWITVFPGLALVMLVLSVNLLGDWLRDALNPKLQ
jgi:peptide/nickel transport system permease protein